MIYGNKQKSEFVYHIQCHRQWWADSTHFPSLLKYLAAFLFPTTAAFFLRESISLIRASTYFFLGAFGLSLFLHPIISKFIASFRMLPSLRKTCPHHHTGVASTNLTLCSVIPYICIKFLCYFYLSASLHTWLF